jgi:hypothetical protein
MSNNNPTELAALAAMMASMASGASPVLFM